MLSGTYYSQNYASIIRPTLPVDQLTGSETLFHFAAQVNAMSSLHIPHQVGGPCKGFGGLRIRWAELEATLVHGLARLFL